MDNRFEISGAACVFGAMLCLAVPLDWIAASVTAAAFHEFSHILAVYGLGGRIHKFRIGICGAVLEASQMDPVRNMICILSGPAGSFGLLLIAKRFPKIAVCGLIQGVFNLMPVYPLDGGRVLESIIRMTVPPDKQDRVLMIIRTGILGFLFTVCFSLCFRQRRYAAFLLIYVPLFYFIVMKGKISCKEGDM